MIKIDNIRGKILSIIVISVMLVLLGTTIGATTTGNGALVYQPTQDSFDPAGATYGRILSLKHSGASNGNLLATFDQLRDVTVTMSDGSSATKQVYPIYRSTNDGSTWQHISNVFDEEYDLKYTSQPFLYELPQQVGNLAKGTLLLAGNIFDKSPATVTRIVIYKSTDGGLTWSFLSQVDQGGPYSYDPSTSSTTTTVWEPSLELDSDGNLVCYYSDERQKSNNVLQAVVLKKSTDGLTWGSVVNVTAIANSNDRPGMITVAKLPNGKYITTYEVVNLPSITNNTAVVYYKFSDDGVTWDASDLGSRLELSNGRGLGSSPFVKWVPTGGPFGTVIVSSKWAVDAQGNIDGGQNFYVNYNLGQGDWERSPFAVTYDSEDVETGSYFTGFSQGFDVSADGMTLYQITNVENTSNTTVHEGNTYAMNDIRVGSIPLNSDRYEAEKATLTDVLIVNHVDAINGKKVGNINNVASEVAFNVKVLANGTYQINVRYTNGMGSNSTHSVSVNEGTAFDLTYMPTVNWDRYLWADFSAQLTAGYNTIDFSKGNSYAEIDCIEIYRTDTENKDTFKIINRNSDKYLEVGSASTTLGANIVQWSNTDHMCQNWYIVGNGNYFEVINAHSDQHMEIDQASLIAGANVQQWSDSTNYSQEWTFDLTDSGYMELINRNSGLVLEVASGSVSDGANVLQWNDNIYSCQEWHIVHEGIQ